MPSFGVQQAFTSAILGGDSDLDNIVDLASEADNFQQRVNSLLPDNQITNAALIGGLVVVSVAAVAGIGLVISNRLQTVEDEREYFLDMVNQKTVGFLVLDSQSSRNAYGNYVAEFIRLLKEEHPRLMDISGLKRKTSTKEGSEGTLYISFSIPSLPFGVHYDQPRDDGDQIDESVQFLNFLLGGEFEELLAKVRVNIKDNFLNNASLFFEGRDHVQWLNSTRIVAILLANIALNITQGIKPYSKIPLTIPELKERCAEFRSFLLLLRGQSNKILSANKYAMCESELLDKFIARMNDRINLLELAYNAKLKDDLNLSDVISSGYALLNNATRPLRRLLYPHGAMDDPALFFSHLINLQTEISIFPDLISRAVKKLDLKTFNPHDRQLNSTPSTVIDLLAIYASCKRRKRQSMLARFKRAEDNDFKGLLASFDEKYIYPIEDMTGSYGILDLSTKNVINSASNYLICFVSLMLESHNVTLLDKKDGCLSSNEQANLFLKNALNPGFKYGFGYFQNTTFVVDWGQYINALIKLVFGVRHLGLTTTLTETNLRYLQTSHFQDFIKEHLLRLSHTHEEFLRIKENAILRGQRSGKQNTVESLIVSEINSKVPHKNTQMPDLSDTFIDCINRAERVIVLSTFDDNKAEQERALISRVQTYDLTARDANDTKGKFYSSLYGFVSPEKIINYDIEAAIPKTYTDQKLQTDISINNDGRGTSPSFWLKALDVVFAVSLALFLAGLLTLLILTYVESVALLPVAAQSALMITGLAALGSGGIGFVGNVFATRFFNHKDDLLPLVGDKPDLTTNTV